MANTVPSPYMGMPIPVVALDPGQDWAENVNASLSITDSHNHSPGQGQQITPTGLNISSDLTFQGNNATNLRSARFSPQAAPIALAADIGCLYEAGVDLYYNDGNGNQVRITQSGSVSGASGTITGLPSGTASASFSGSTFTFQSATNTPATMAIGPIVLGYPSVSPHTVTISPTTGQPANYNLFLPAAAPAANQIWVSDGSGNLTWLSGYVPSGTFTATLGGVVGTVTATWQYAMVGNLVTISTAVVTLGFTKNSSNGAVTVTGLPAAILPTTTVSTSGAWVSYNDSGSPSGYPLASCSATTAGLTIYRDNGQDVFAGNTQNSLTAFSLTYVRQ